MMESTDKCGGEIPWRADGKQRGNNNKNYNNKTKSRKKGLNVGEKGLVLPKMYFYVQLP